jgi:hypothetical protein
MGKDKWTPGFFNGMRQMGDSLADHTIQVLFEEHGVEAVSHVLEGLITNDQPLPAKPARLSARADKAWRDYFARSAILPRWARPALIKKGEQVYMEHGMMGFSILGCASLPEAYATDYAAKVLGITQQLERHVRRRIYETTQFVIDVMSGGGLQPRGKGIRAAQKVRLMHAAIRHLIRTVPQASAINAQPRTLAQALLKSRWPKRYGTPIHQAAMSMAVLSFSYIVLRSLRKLGVRLHRAEIATKHNLDILRNYCCLFLGVLQFWPLYRWYRHYVKRVTGAELDNVYEHVRKSYRALRLGMLDYGLFWAIRA